MNRTTPTEVRRRLRKEVGFGCPIPGCGNPYLYWHHFDPPWHEQQHHNPDGMIALCAEHHAKADAGAYTKEQLRDFKRQAAERSQEVRGRFEWMRRNLLAVVGGNFFYETLIIFEFRGQPIIWFNRDEDGYLLLNIRMLTKSGQPRIQIEDNFWLSRGEPIDLESPPSGKLLRVSYPNDDALKIEFFELESVAELRARYPEVRPERWGVRFPITAVEVYENVGGTNIEFGPRETRLPGMTLRNNFMRGCRAGIALG